MLANKLVNVLFSQFHYLLILVDVNNNSICCYFTIRVQCILSLDSHILMIILLVDVDAGDDSPGG